MLPQRRSAGFTVIELMITVAVLAVVAVIAVPSFQSIIERNQTATQANGLLSALQFARSEAVKRGETVRLSEDTAGFDTGWCVHTGTSCDSTTAIREFEKAGSVTVSSAETEVVFSSRGERVPQSNTNITINVQPSSCTTGEVGRSSVIEISLSGRSEVVKGDCL